MIEFLLNTALIVLLFSLTLVIIRMIKGPTVMDRLLCFDGISICIISILVLLFIKWGSGYFIDLILVFSVLGFFGTIVVAAYLDKVHPTLEDPKGNNND